ncbi:MAG: hypothetical protein ACMXX7_01465 [Candidatus Woesearchaeota archaeon]
MKKEVLLLLIVSIILISTPQINAQETVNVENAILEWAGQEIKIVGVRTDPFLIANLRFNLTTQANLENIAVDITSLNQQLTYQQEYSNKQASCTKTDDKYECIVTGVRLYMEQSSDKIIRIKSNEEEIATKTLDITLDNSNPTVNSITTENCHDGTCFISPGVTQRINIALSGSQAGFSLRNNIFLRIGTQQNIGVVNCEENECLAITTIQQCPTTGGGQITARLEANSRDDAGRRITNDYSTTLRCDPNPPQIQDVTITNQEGSQIIADSDTLRINMNIRETASRKLTIQVNSEMFEETIERECESSESEFICTIDIEQTKTTPGVHNLQIRVRDLAGNTATTNIQIPRIYEETDREIDFWNVQNVRLSSSSINIRNLAYTRQVYGQITLNTNQNVKIHDATARSCEPTHERYGEPGNIDSIRVINFDDQNLYVTFNVQEYGTIDNNRYEDINRLEFSCLIDINSRTDTRIYSVPEQQNVTISISLRKDRTLDGFAREERQKVQEEFERERQNLGRIIQNINTLKAACEIGNAVMGMNAAMAAVSNIFSLAAGTISWVPGVGQSTVQAADGLEVTVESTSTATTGVMGTFMAACKLVMCEESFTEQIFERLDADIITDITQFRYLDGIPGLGEIADYGLGYENPSDILNPYRSEYVAWTQMCIPAILHHREERLLTKCEYADCLSHGIENMGMSVTECAYNKAYSDCLRTASNIVNAFPATAIVQEAGQVISGILRDPIAFIGFGSAYICRALPPVFGLIRAGCLLHENVQSLTSSVGIVMGTVQVVVNLDQLLSTESRALNQCQAIFSAIEYRDTLQRLSREDTARANTNLMDPEGFRRTFPPDSENPDMVCDGARCTLNRNGVRTTIIPEVEDGELVYGETMIHTGRGFVKFDDYVGRLFDDTSRLTGIGEGGTVASFNPIEDYRIHIQDKKLQPSAEGLIDFINENRPDIDPSIIVEDGQGGFYIDLQRASGLVMQLADTINEAGSARQEFEREIEEQFTAIGTYTGRGDLKGVTSQSVKDYIDYQMNEDFRKEQQKNIRVQTILLGDFDTDIDRVNRLKEEYNDCRNNIDTVESCIQKVDDSLKQIMRDNKELEKAVDQAIIEHENNMAKQYRRAIDIQRYDNLFGSTSRATRTAFGTARSVQAIRGWFGATEPRWPGYMGAVGDAMEIAADFVDRYTNLEHLACEVFLTRPEPSDGARLINYGAGSSITGGAYITGRMSSVTGIPDVQDKYTYYITGGVSSVKREGLRFRIELRGDQTYDLTRDIIDNSYFEMETRRPIRIPQQNVLVYEDTRKFDEVCIVFLANDMTQYFDSASRDQTEICQRFDVDPSDFRR